MNDAMTHNVDVNVIFRRTAHKEIIVVNCTMYIHAVNITLIPADILYEETTFPPPHIILHICHSH